MKLLHLDSSILSGNSASRQITAAIAGQLANANPGLGVTYRDLSAHPLSHLSGELFAARQGAVPESAEMQKDVAASQAVLDEFLAADTVVIGAPMYNFGISTQLKSWIDRIAVAGKTFKYGLNGPEGLAGGKHVIIAISRGGLYSAGSPAASLEHAESYLRAVFAFLGVTSLEIVLAEGLAIHDQREKAMQGALRAATELRAA
jgi:FMN-dependent NADH-azoreductase